MKSGLMQHVQDYQELIFISYDAGRITESRGRELMGFDQLLDFRDAYRHWKETQRKFDQSRRPASTALWNLDEAARAVSAATDTGEDHVQPDEQLLRNLEEAIQAVRALLVST